MSFFGAVRILLATGSGLPDPAEREAPPAMAPGTWAAWANGDARDRSRGARLGDACRTGAGRDGRLVEITERGRSWLVCLES
jgi:hypothetical protein